VMAASSQRSMQARALIQTKPFSGGSSWLRNCKKAEMAGERTTADGSSGPQSQWLISGMQLGR